MHGMVLICDPVAVCSILLHFISVLYTWRPCVGVTVYLHVNFLVKPFATVRADEGFEVGVSAHVRVQVGGPVEGLLADGAHVGFDGGVGQTVPGQVARLTEGSATHLAFERLLTRVDAL